MRNLRIPYCVCLGLLLVVLACAPKATPQPTPTPRTEDTGWARVVEDARKEGKVTLYTFNFTGDVGVAVNQAFQTKYGISVELIAGVGATLIEKIKGEQAGGRYVADTLDTAVALMGLAKREGLTASAGSLPVLSQQDVWVVHPRKLDPETHLISFIPVYYYPYVNTTLVKPGDEPKSYKEMLDPKWKGKIVTSDPNTMPYLPYLYATMVPRKILDDDFFRKLAKQEVRMAPSVRDDAGMLLRGERAVSLMGTGAIVNTLIQQGGPIRPVEAQEGAILSGGMISLVKNGPHPNAARLFVDWLLSAEGQTVFHQARKTTPIRKGIADFTPGAGQLAPKTVIETTMDVEMETARLMREKVIAKLMGLE